MRDLLLLLRFKSSAKRKVLEWVQGEWVGYAEGKLSDVWSEEQNDQALREGGLRQDGYWFNQIMQYWGRAEALGLETPQGRQLAMKSITTMIDAGASIIRVYGDPPLPGYTSGEIHTRGDGCSSHEMKER